MKKDKNNGWKISTILLIIVCLIVSITLLTIYIKENKCEVTVSKGHLKTVTDLGEKICQLKDVNCHYSDYEDVCYTGKAVDKIVCDCSEKPKLIRYNI